MSRRSVGQWPWFCILTLALLSSGCEQERSGEPVDQREIPTRDINEVMNDHTAEIMKIPGVSGMYIGELDNGTPCITVLVKVMTAEIREKVPERLEGHPVVVEEVGEIKPMNGGE